MVVKAGGPSVTMISAGLVLTKIVGTASGDKDLPGIALRTSLKLGSSGRLFSASGNGPAGLHGPVAFGAASQLPSSRRYHWPSPAGAWNTSQFVLTATESVEPLTGTNTGSPSNTTRLAGRA